MSKLDELIAELCPDGVEYKPLSEIATITRGGSLQKKDFTESGYPCIHYGQIYTRYGLFTDKTYTFVSEATALRQKKAVTGDIVMAVTSENIEDVCKCVVWLGNGDVAVSGHTAIIHHNQNPKYLAYYFHSSMFFAQKQKLAHGTKVIEVTPDKLNGVRVPVPPLEVQREIVRVLDNFTFLSAELSAELSARRKQYEYYSNNLFPSVKDKDISWIELGSVATVTKLAGFEFTKYVTYSEEGKVIALRGLNVKNGHLVLDDVKYIDGSDLSMLTRSKLHIGDMLFTYVGTIGQVALVDEEDKYYLAPNVALVRVNNEYLPKYMMYYFLTDKFRSEQINKLLQASSMQNIPMEKIRKFKLPVIDKEEQQHVVAMLDQFDQLCNGITEGLPAEIEARQKQYEYYRDKLLTFKEL